MSDPELELPGPPPGGPAPGHPEGMGPVTRQTRGLYETVIWILGLVLVVGVVGWLALAFTGRAMPDGLGVVIGTVAGGLVGLISDNSNKK
jgi:hypothetical protein